MRHKTISRKWLSWILAIVIIVTSAAPLTAFAVGGGTEHIHDDSCGYVEAVEGQACTHVHDANCGYSEGTAETPCDMECTDTDGDGTIDHAEGCAYQPATEGALCLHEHDDSCGYVEAVEGSPCQYEADGAQDSGEQADAEVIAVCEAVADAIEAITAQAENAAELAETACFAYEALTPEQQAEVYNWAEFERIISGGAEVLSGDEVTTAQELIDAIAAAADGDTITLGANITYAQSSLGTIEISKSVIIDFNGYKITVDKDMFAIPVSGALTFVDAELETTGDNSGYCLIDENYGTFTIESTAGTGIVTEEDIVEYNYGSVIIKSGTYRLGYSLVYENHGSGSIVIEDADLTADSYVIGYNEDAGNTITINGGSFTTDCNVISGIYNGTVTINGGDFTVTGSDEDGFYVEGGQLIFKGGSVTSTDNVICAYEGSVILYGGTFTSTGDAALYAEAAASITIANGYKAIPDDWETTAAAVVKVLPVSLTLTFISEGQTVSETTDAPENHIFPSDPVHSQGYDFLYWENAKGEPVDDVTTLTEDTTLYAVFSDRTYTVTFSDKGVDTAQTVTAATPLGEVAGLDRTDEGDGFFAWKLGNDIVDENTTTPVYSDLTLTAIYAGMVMTYDELIAALGNKDEAITLGAEIPVTAEVVVDYDCIIDGNGFGLIRPEGYAGILLSVENGVAGGESEPGVETDGTTLRVRNAYIDGSNLDAYNSAVYVRQGATLIMNDVTVKNNRTLSGTFNNVRYSGDGGGIYLEPSTKAYLSSCTIQNNYARGDGGGLYFEDDYNIASGSASLTNCVVQNNTSDYSGGGIYLYSSSRHKAVPTLILTGCDVINNSALSEGGGIYAENSNFSLTKCSVDNNTAGRYGGGLNIDNWSSDYTEPVTMTDTIISNNSSSGGGGMYWEGALVHLYGTTSFEYNKSSGDGGGVYSCGGNPDDCILYMHDTSSMSYNEAEEDGGAVSCDECLLVMYDNSSIHHNKAGGDGGGVYASSYGMIQEGGVIRDNYAAERGGGVYAQDDSFFTAGRMYDNTAGEAGDDLYNDYNDLKTLYPTQANRMYGDGNSLNLGTVNVEPISGYYDVPLDAISIPYYGWFIDGELISSTWDRVNQQYIYVYENRYVNARESVIVSKDNGNLGFLAGELEETGGKAIWYGLLLAYDVNYEGSTEHQYDTLAYLPDTNATILANMFSRPGYSFVCWNTQADGSGTEYTAYDLLKMDKSQVLYAQWVKNPVGSLTVSKTISGNAASATQEFDFTVTLDDSTISGTYGDMTFENGVATFTLKAGESKSATGLPAGVGYTVEESNNAGYTVTVNGSSEMTATGTITADTTAEAAFNNHKTGGGTIPSPATVTIQATKTLDGQSPTGSAFSFVLRNENGSVVQTKSNNGGQIEFSPLSFSTTGTYIYTLTESVGTSSGINYDTAVYRVTVQVSLSGNYQATVSYEKDGQPYTGVPAFANTTKTGTGVSVSVNKQWDDGNITARPESVRVQLYRNGTAYGDAVVLNTVNGWQHTWTDLDETATWTVDETSVPTGYTKSVSASGNAWTITNKLVNTPSPKPTDPDQPVPTPLPTPTPIPDPDVPSTDDASNQWLWWCLAAISACGLLLTGLYSRKYCRKSKRGAK